MAAAWIFGTRDGHSTGSLGLCLVAAPSTLMVTPGLVLTFCFAGLWWFDTPCVDNIPVIHVNTPHLAVVLAVDLTGMPDGSVYYH